jgi:hypothetical protein
MESTKGSYLASCHGSASATVTSARAAAIAEMRQPGPVQARVRGAGKMEKTFHEEKYLRIIHPKVFPYEVSILHGVSSDAMSQIG